MVWIDIFFSFVCPSMGCILSSAMYSAPVQDLQHALINGELENLNPVPWAVMTGNCLGWCVYGYYTSDPFILASNLPGLMVSVWLNLGASKLQYYQLRQTQYDDWDAHHSEENLLEAHDSISIAPSDNLTTRTDAIPKKQDFIFVSQETLLLRILFTWITIVVAVGWLGLVQNRAAAIGILVNVNLIFFYGAPLQTIRTVLQTQSSDSIHRPTMMMNFLNTLFWLLYGIARHDIYIFGPNAIGLILGILQATLCCYYSSTTTNGSVSESDNQEPLLPQDEISPEGIG